MWFCCFGSVGHQDCSMRQAIFSFRPEHHHLNRIIKNNIYWSNSQKLIALSILLREYTSSSCSSSRHERIVSITFFKNIERSDIHLDPTFVQVGCGSSPRNGKKWKKRNGRNHISHNVFFSKWLQQQLSCCWSKSFLRFREKWNMKILRKKHDVDGKDNYKSSEQ